MTRFFFITLMLSIILGMNFYVFLRLSRLVYADARLVVPLMLSVLFAAAFVVPVLTGFAPVLYRLATAWFFIALYLLLLFLLLDLFRLALSMQKVLNGNWLTLGALAVLLTAVFSYGYVHYRHKARVELSIALKAKEISPLRIVVVSDLHLGYTIGKAELDEWVELINAEHPDLVLIAGDIKDNSLRPLREQNIATSFRNIQARYGVYACAGNHEYIGGSPLRGAGELAEFFREANITFLCDSSALISNEFYIIGRDDRTNTHRKPLAELLAPLDRTKPLILLDHQPYRLEEAEQNGVDLQLSGHTHRGQVAPLSWIADRLYEQSHGYLRKGDTHIYVSSGIGIWGGKFRIGTQSEYVVVRLKSEQRPLR